MGLTQWTLVVPDEPINSTTERYPRSLADAFPHVRAHCFEGTKAVDHAEWMQHMERRRKAAVWVLGAVAAWALCLVVVFWRHV